MDVMYCKLLELLEVSIGRISEEKICDGIMELFKEAAQETEDELWKEVGQIIIEHFFAGMSLPLGYKLKSKFTIQRRKPQ